MSGRLRYAEDHRDAPPHDAQHVCRHGVPAEEASGACGVGVEAAGALEAVSDEAGEGAGGRLLRGAGRLDRGVHARSMGRSGSPRKA